LIQAIATGAAKIKQGNDYLDDKIIL